MSSDESVVVVATITPLPEHRETAERVLTVRRPVPAGDFAKGVL